MTGNTYEASPLRPTERIDDLLTYDLKIIQSDEVFSFSTGCCPAWPVLQCAAQGANVDLCTGNGVVPLLLSTRTRAEIWGVEIQERLADMAVRNAEINESGRTAAYDARAI